MATVISAPGKVLITGAYLVTEQPNPGLVLSTSARFYAIVTDLLVPDEQESMFWSYINVKVSSPQLDSTKEYYLSLAACKLDKLFSSKANFVEDAIQFGVATALAIANERLGEGGRDKVYKHLKHGLDITILGSNDFYSFRKVLEAKGLPLTAASLASLPAFSGISLNCSSKSDTTPELAKTGLGSSASMTTAIVAGILHHLGVVKLDSEGDSESLDIIHVASQAAHCHAQQKIGSGFDVSAAVYGSQKYVRFSPDVVSAAVDAPLDEHGKPLSLEKAMKNILNSESWDSQRSNFALPPMLYLMLGEPGHGGSHTPSMVGKVNTWRKTRESAEYSWKKLADANLTVENDLLQLKLLYQQNPDDYALVLEACSKCKWNEWKPDNEISSCLIKLREDFNAIRSLLRQIGEEAGAPIEPPEQTDLLNKTMDLEGVAFAGVPGAGGHDAVFAITFGGDSRNRVEKLWSENGVLTLNVEEDPRGVHLEKNDPRQTGLTKQG